MKGQTFTVEKYCETALKAHVSVTLVAAGKMAWDVAEKMKTRWVFFPTPLLPSLSLRGCLPCNIFPIAAGNAIQWGNYSSEKNFCAVFLTILLLSLQHTCPGQWGRKKPSCCFKSWIIIPTSECPLTGNYRNQQHGLLTRIFFILVSMIGPVFYSHYTDYDVSVMPSNLKKILWCCTTQFTVLQMCFVVSRI